MTKHSTSVQTLKAVLDAFNAHGIMSSFAVTGSIGVSQWTLWGTRTGGEEVEVRGCDFFTFANGKNVKKDSYRKIRDQ